MGMYSMVFKPNILGPVMMAALGYETPMDVGRYRDCIITKSNEIVIYTRNGGANRESYTDDIERMRSHACYLRDVDDSFDSTYASFYFRFPDGFKEDFEKMAELIGVDWNPDERWKKAIDAMESQEPADDQTIRDPKETIEGLKPVLDNIMSLIKDSGSGSN